MDFTLNERQRLLQQTARRLFDDAGGPKALEAAARENGYDPALWRRFADLGWLGLLAPTGEPEMPDALDAATLTFEMGRALVPSPFVQTAILAVHVLGSAGGPAAGAEIDAIAAGERIWVLAHLGYAGHSGSPTDDAALSADRLSGTRPFVDYGEQAQRFIVTAAGEEGSLRIAAAAAGDTVACERLITLDDRPQAIVTFSGTPVLGEVLLQSAEAAGQAFADLQDWGAVMASAEMAGAGDRILEMTLQYLKDRTQFGRPIGSFQALQHHAANMSIDVQAMRLTTLQAAWSLATGAPNPAAIAAAKGWSSEALHRVVESGHQMHGAIGFTIEHDMQRFYRRAKSLEIAFGAGREHQLAMARARIQELAVV